MSIASEISARISEGRLVEFKPFAPSSMSRLVYLTPDINDQIKGPWESGSEEEAQMPYVLADLENFALGFWVLTALGRGPKVNFRRLEVRRRKRPETWEMRTMEPPPGYRLFGFFADADKFVGLHLVSKDLVNNDEDMKHAQSKWRNLFGTFNPVVSENINDYISENVERLR